jgi:DNA repair photolyase
MQVATKEINVKWVMTKSNLPIWDFSVNPYVWCAHWCKYCYASFMKRFTNHKEPRGEFVDVKYRDPIQNPEKYKWKTAVVGSVTDPYQPCELKYWRTRALLEQLQWSWINLLISTRSNLIERDIDLIKTFPNVRVSFSINTLDEEFKKDMDYASSIENRLLTMKKLYDAWIYTSCFISPIFPWITDVISIIERAKKFSNLVWLENLNLRWDYKWTILKYIHEKHPELDDLYYQIYTKKDRSYWYELDEKIREYTLKHWLKYVRDDDSEWSKHWELPVVVNYFFHEEVKRTAKSK